MWSFRRLCFLQKRHFDRKDDLVSVRGVALSGKFAAGYLLPLEVEIVADVLQRVESRYAPGIGLLRVLVNANANVLPVLFCW